jgi:ABC-type multidrug transport system permease subunit
MSAVHAPTATPASIRVRSPSPAPRPITPAVMVRDIARLARRNLLHIIRTPKLLLFASVQPVMFVLLFRYVFGGAIHTPGVDYVNYLLPGIFVQTALFGGSATAVGLAADLQGGMIDRFRSLPTDRSAVLAGRTVADLVRNCFVVLLMVAVGLLVGFRFHGTVTAGIAALGLVLLFGYAFSWLFALIRARLVVRPEAATYGRYVDARPREASLPLP